MEPCCLRSLLRLVAFLVLAAPAAFAAEAVSITVDATETAQKLLHTKLIIPVKPGPVTVYYPKWIPGGHGPQGPIANVTGLKFEAGEKPSRGSAISWMYLRFTSTFRRANHLKISFDYIEPDGISATDKLMALEWNEALLYPAGAPADQLIYKAKLILPRDWKFGTALPVESQSGNELSFKPISLDLLVDSPVIAGEYFRSIDLTPPGEPIHHEIDIVADSEAALDMSPQVQKGMTNLVAESARSLARATIAITTSC